MDEIITCKQLVGNIPDAIWEEIKPFILNAAEYAEWEFTPESTREWIRKEMQQVWIVRANGQVKFVWVTEIVVQAYRKAVIVFAAAGESRYGWDFWNYMSNWMEGNDILEAEVYCRPSMARLLRKKGLRTRYEVLTIKPFGGTDEQQSA